ncbi:MAG: hypothetical protein AB1597_07170 [Chloroflexota bacterium]
MKWTLLYGEYTSIPRRALTVGNFNYLLNLMHDLEGHLRKPSEYENMFLFFRNMAFQQFWLEHEFNMLDFARQSVLFGKLDPAHRFQASFLEKAGIPLPQFIELAMMLMTRFTVEKKGSVTPEWFRTVVKAYEAGTIERFLTFLSADITTLRVKLGQTRDPNRKVSYEVYEKSPLREMPLLEYHGVYYPFSPQLLARSLETKIYDTLRKDDPQGFMNTFGPIFERYVGGSLSNIGAPVIPEQELARVVPSVGKLVDYLVVDGETTVFIDAKGVEMSYLGMVGHQPEVIKDKTGNSIIKGIEQALGTASRLEGINEIAGVPIRNGNKYLIVVTFKDMFVGNGIDFYEYVAKETLDRIVSRYAGAAPIPFGHMYFVSVDDFDMMVSAIVSGATDLTRLLQQAVADDALAATKKFTFGQHVRKICPEVESPKWLYDESKSILDRCACRFDKKP